MRQGLLELLGTIRLVKGNNYVELAPPSSIATNFTLTASSALPTTTSTVLCDPSGNLTFQTAVSSARAYRTNFNNSSLSSGVLLVTHQLNVSSTLVQVYDSNGKAVIPDSIAINTANACNVDLSSFGTLTGTWNVLVMG